MRRRKGRRPYSTSLSADRPGMRKQSMTPAERKTKSRCERELRDQGFEPIKLWLPPAIRAAWKIRERSSDPNAPLREEFFDDDMIVIMLYWTVIWLSPVEKIGGTLFIENRSVPPKCPAWNPPMAVTEAATAEYDVSLAMKIADR